MEQIIKLDLINYYITKGTRHSRQAWESPLSLLAASPRVADWSPRSRLARQSPVPSAGSARRALQAGSQLRQPVSQD